jgi:hypothetical protein
MSESELKLYEPCCSKSLQENIVEGIESANKKRKPESSIEGSIKKSHKGKVEYKFNYNNQHQFIVFI